MQNVIVHLKNYNNKKFLFIQLSYSWEKTTQNKIVEKEDWMSVSVM